MSASEPIDVAALERTLAPRFAAFSGRATLALADLRPGALSEPIWEIDADAVRPSASVVKLFLLIHALREVAAGRLDEDERIPLRAPDRVDGNGVLQFLSPGLEPTLGDLLTLMITLSDNTATNLVIDRLGLEPVRATCAAEGWRETFVSGRLQLPPERWSDAQRAGRRNTTSARDALDLLVRLERGSLLPPAQTARARAILRAQLYTEALARWLPTDPEEFPEGGRRPLATASKSGCLPGLWHDAGIVYAPVGGSGEPEPVFALAVLTTDASDRAEHWEQEGMLLIAHVAREVARAFGLPVRDPPNPVHPEAP